MGILVDENLSLEQLRKYPVVYLPGVAIISEQEAALFDKYVQDGGNLLVTGISGQYDRAGNLLPKNRLRDLLGVETEKCIVDHSDNYLRLPSSLAKGKGQFLTAGIPQDWTLLVWGPAVACKSTGAEAFGELLTAYRTVWSEWSDHLSAKDVIGPAVFINKHGKGTVIYVPAAIDSAYATDFFSPEHRNFIGNLIRQFSTNPVVVVDASAPRRNCRHTRRRSPPDAGAFPLLHGDANILGIEL